MSAAEKQQLTEQLAQAQAALSAVSHGTTPAGSGGVPGGSGTPPSGGVALQLVKVLQQQVGNLEARLKAQEKQRKALKKVSDSSFPLFLRHHQFSHNSLKHAILAASLPACLFEFVFGSLFFCACLSFRAVDLVLSSKVATFSVLVTYAPTQETLPTRLKPLETDNHEMQLLVSCLHGHS